MSSGYQSQAGAYGGTFSTAETHYQSMNSLSSGSGRGSIFTSRRGPRGDWDSRSLRRRGRNNRKKGKGGGSSSTSYDRHQSTYYHKDSVKVPRKQGGKIRSATSSSSMNTIREAKKKPTIDPIVREGNVRRKITLKQVTNVFTKIKNHKGTKAAGWLLQKGTQLTGIVLMGYTFYLYEAMYYDSRNQTFAFGEMAHAVMSTAVRLLDRSQIVYDEDPDYPPSFADMVDFMGKHGFDKHDDGGEHLQSDDPQAARRDDVRQRERQAKSDGYDADTEDQDGGGKKARWRKRQREWEEDLKEEQDKEEEEEEEEEVDVGFQEPSRHEIDMSSGYNGFRRRKRDAGGPFVRSRSGDAVSAGLLQAIPNMEAYLSSLKDPQKDTDFFRCPHSADIRKVWMRDSKRWIQDKRHAFNLMSHRFEVTPEEKKRMEDWFLHLDRQLRQYQTLQAITDDLLLALDYRMHGIVSVCVSARVLSVRVRACVHSKFV